MSSLTFADRRDLERAFTMGSGYVLNFSDRTFREFVFDTTRRDIGDGRFAARGTSKANRLRTFWELEDDHTVVILLRALIEHARSLSFMEEEALTAAERVAERLSGEAAVSDADALVPNAGEPTFHVLAKAVRQAIDDGKPEEGLDRLHTFLTKYLRVACDARGINTPRDKPLHSLMGEYVKSLRTEGRLQSAMSERIAKSAISTLEAFNGVRNEQSLAHDNSLLASHEALYIFNHVASLVRFLQVIEAGEGRGARIAAPDSDEAW